MKIIPFLLALIVCIQQAKSQNIDSVSLREESMLIDYMSQTMAEYFFTNEIEHNQDSLFEILNTETSWLYSYIGEYEKSLVANDKDFESWGELTQEDINYFKQFKPQNAKNYILQRAKYEKIIAMNEAHFQPNHRVFTASLLENLYSLGFRYLAIETLSNNSTVSKNDMRSEVDFLNDRKYPTITSGYYLKEPQYGNLVRDALKIGFTLIGYEAKIGHTNQVNRQVNREIEQAKNLAKIFEKDKNAKMLIHCGYSHIREDSVDGWVKAMCGRLKEFTGINPFTIDQEVLTERSQKKYENPFYKMIKIKESSVFINEIGEIFNGKKDSKSYDIRVAHPRTIYQYGRPTWLLRDDGWKFFEIQKESIKISYPIMIFAYNLNENKNRAIPLDVIEISKHNIKKALILPKGVFDLKIKNNKGDEQELRIKVE